MSFPSHDLDAFDALVASKHDVAGAFLFPDDYVVDYPFVGRVFRDLVIRGGSFTTSIFRECRFLDVRLEDVAMDFTVFEECTFFRAELVHCSIEGLTMDRCEGAWCISG